MTAKLSPAFSFYMKLSQLKSSPLLSFLQLLSNWYNGFLIGVVEFITNVACSKYLIDCHNNWTRQRVKHFIRRHFYLPYQVEQRIIQNIKFSHKSSNNISNTSKPVQLNFSYDNAFSLLHHNIGLVPRLARRYTKEFQQN